MDLQMPALNGIEAIIGIRSDSPMPHDSVDAHSRATHFAVGILCSQLFQPGHQPVSFSRGVSRVLAIHGLRGHVESG
jgi:CheY-like chemotaxis protein